MIIWFSIVIVCGHLYIDWGSSDKSPPALPKVEAPSFPEIEEQARAFDQQTDKLLRQAKELRAEVEETSALAQAALERLASPLPSLQEKFPSFPSSITFHRDHRKVLEITPDSSLIWFKRDGTKITISDRPDLIKALEDLVKGRCTS